MMMIKHFSHNHPLSPFQVEDDDDDDQEICSGCELHLLPNSSAYKCDKPGCDFHLHELCSELPRETKHASHTQHPLVLLFTPPPSFSCKACTGSGTAFIYACPTCPFALHVHCSALPHSVLRHDHHSHPLKLVFSLPEKDGAADHACALCGCGFVEACWAYLCRDCGYGVHLECAITEDDDEDDAGEESSEITGVNMIAAKSQNVIAV